LIISDQELIAAALEQALSPLSKASVRRSIRALPGVV